MNRRSFFKGLGFILAAGSAPGIFIPKFDPGRWKMIKGVPYLEIVTPMQDYRQFYGKWQFVTFDNIIGNAERLYQAEYVSKVWTPDREK